MVVLVLVYGDGSVQRTVFWSYNLSHHHQCVHSSHTNPPEAVVGALERELVVTVGSGRGRTLTKRTSRRLNLGTIQQLRKQQPLLLRDGGFVWGSSPDTSSTRCRWY